MKKFNKNIEEKKIELKQNRNTYIKRLSISLSCLILVCVIILFTFAKFESSSDEYTLIHGVIGQDGDVTVSYIIDGQSVSAPPTKGSGYRLKSVNCTNGDGTWDKRGWGLYVNNMTGKVICNLEFETASEVEVTIYSAALDEIYYMEGAEKVVLGTTDSTGKLNVTLPVQQSITLYSTVAKDPNNLSNPYTKTINPMEITGNIYLMPTSEDKMVYWYGFKGNCESIMSDNGWDIASPYTSYEPTYNTNNATIDYSYIYAWGGIGMKNATVFNKLNLIHSETGAPAGVGDAWGFGAASSKTGQSNNFAHWNSPIGSPTYTSATNASTDLRYAYVFASSTHVRTYTIYAFWSE